MNHRGQVSQSFQVAPFNYQYEFNQNSPATTIYNTSITAINSYKGAQYQQAVSAVSYIDSNNYNDNAYTTYGYEYWSNPSRRQEGYITWYSEGQQTWKITPDAIGPDNVARINGRIIPEEPMVGLPAISLFYPVLNLSQYLILNFGMACAYSTC